MVVAASGIMALSSVRPIVPGKPVKDGTPFRFAHRLIWS
jgi:hypothetical protein